MKILAIGDIVGKPGRQAVKKLVPLLKKRENIHFVVANGENAAGGSGMTPPIVEELLGYGVDVLTSGDHIWKKKEIEEIIDRQPRLLRPLNFPAKTPGIGSTIIEVGGNTQVGVICLLGRVFLNSIECPFRAVKRELESMRKSTKIILVDIHAEATSEKVAMGWYLDGQVSLVFGTHTHIQTADEKILPEGTAYITDLGMAGPYKSVLGRRVEDVLQRFITQMPVRFEMAEEDVQLHGAIVEVDEFSGKALSIKRVQEKMKDEGCGT